MSAQVSIFLRDDQVILIPQGGGGGLSYDIEPSLVVPAEAGKVGTAALQAIEISRQSQTEATPPRTRASSAPVLKKLRLKSYKEFYRGASHCYLYEENGVIFMLRFRPAQDGAGFDLASSQPETIDNRERLGEIVLECLKSSPRMP
jgi:hypothetical protein